jgi:hypothetical protein
MAAKNFAHISTIFVAIITVPSALAINLTHTTNPAVTNYARPLSFEPNRGQADNQVDFLAHGNDTVCFCPTRKPSLC